MRTPPPPPPPPPPTHTPRQSCPWCAATRPKRWTWRLHEGQGGGVTGERFGARPSAHTLRAPAPTTVLTHTRTRPPPTRVHALTHARTLNTGTPPPPARTHRPRSPAPSASCGGRCRVRRPSSPRSCPWWPVGWAVVGWGGIGRAREKVHGRDSERGREMPAGSGRRAGRQAATGGQAGRQAASAPASCRAQRGGRHRTRRKGRRWRSRSQRRRCPRRSGV